MILAIVWVLFLAVTAGWIWGRNYEHALMEREAKKRSDWRVHLATNNTLWAERTSGRSFLVGPCADANEMLAAIADARENPET